MEEENKTKTINLCPLGKWKRILLFLGDFAITFILSFVLFNLAVFPLAKLACNTERRAAQSEEYQAAANNMLVSSGLLYEDPNGPKEFLEDVNYTFKVFLSYYAFDEENPDINNPQFGHKAENEVIFKYYKNYLNNESQYPTDFQTENKDALFIVGETVESIKLKDEYKEMLGTELLETTDEDNYSETMVKVRDNVFGRLFYLHVYADIQENDFVIGDESFNNYLNMSMKIASSLQWVATVSSIISVVLSWSVVYLLIPLINRDKKTITLFAVKSVKLNVNGFAVINWKNVLIHSFYDLILSLGVTLFLPILFFGISYCFNLPLLFIFTTISAVLAIASMITIFINEYNRSGSDLLTFTVVVPESEIDNLYKESLENGRLPS